MSATQYWEIDRLAANRLVDRLKIEANPEMVEEIAMEFAEHRAEVQHWVAHRVQSRIIGALEARSVQDFVQKDATWADGFIAAEHMVANLSINDLLDQPHGSAQSKGQVLRSMVRGARKRSTDD
ncbi:hypothetical protein [Aurantiacibacter flavus]|uniref:Uncharacterized protein n=1 Tax=Aurantiacibacter flavus TaxID=3145232 RepID=A0ABV0CVE7_9SPHN